MKANITQFIVLSASIAAWLIGCSTTEVTPQPAPAAAPPAYIQVPQPAGYDLSDLRAIFTDRSAPKADELKDCDADLKKLMTLTKAEEEVKQGTRELIKHDPVKYHWCFYSKILDLENDLKAEGFVDERQKKVLNTYTFLTPVGRAFMQEFHDSRYLRWGVKHYRQVSEWVFYRKLELKPETTVDLVEAINPFGLLREPYSPMPILEKYNIVKPELAAAPVLAPVPVAPAPGAVAEPAVVVPETAENRLPAAENGHMPSMIPGNNRSLDQTLEAETQSAVTPVSPAVPAAESAPPAAATQ